MVGTVAPVTTASMRRALPRGITGTGVAHYFGMPDLQLFNVPEKLVRALEAQAQLRNTSVSEVAVDELTFVLNRRKRSAALARLASLPRVSTKGESIADAVRAERDALVI